MLLLLCTIYVVGFKEFECGKVNFLRIALRFIVGLSVVVPVLVVGALEDFRTLASVITASAIAKM